MAVTRRDDDRNNLFTKKMADKVVITSWCEIDGRGCFMDKLFTRFFSQYRYNTDFLKCCRKCAWTTLSTSLALKHRENGSSLTLLWWNSPTIWFFDVWWAFAYFPWQTPKLPKCRRWVRLRRTLFSTLASQGRRPAAHHPGKHHTAVPPLCAEDRRASAELPAAPDHAAVCLTVLPRQAPKCSCSSGNTQSCTRGADLQGWWRTVPLMPCGVSW